MKILHYQIQIWGAELLDYFKILKKSPTLTCYFRCFIDWTDILNTLLGYCVYLSDIISYQINEVF